MLGARCKFHHVWISTLAFIYIHEESGSNLSEYQIRVDLNESNLHTWPDEPCIKIYQNDTVCSHWVEFWDHVNKSARIWVRVPSIPADTTVRLTIRTSTAVTSNGSATFEYFDDFESYPIDDDASPPWTVLSSGLTVQDDAGNKVLKRTGGDSPLITIGDSSLQNREVIVRIKHISGSVPGVEEITLDVADASTHYMAVFGYSDKLAIYKNGVEQASTSYTIPTDSWIVGKFRRYGNTLTAEVESGPSISWTDSSPLNVNPQGLRVGGGSADVCVGEFDLFCVRKYVSPEPTITVVST